MSHRKRRFGERVRSLYLWHRYIGLCAALLAAWLAATGLLLNHADDLELNEKWVQQDWLLSLYGVALLAPDKALKVPGHWIVATGEHVYVDTTRLAKGRLAGVAPTQFGFVLALSDRLELYSDQLQRIETVPFTQASTPLDGLVATKDGIVLTSAGRAWAADDDFLSFVPLDAVPAGAQVHWLEPPADIAQTIAENERHHVLDWERVLLDLHSGRLFGEAGRWLGDIAGVLLLLLSTTGVWLWVQRRRRRN